jgi:hypothetical protein
MIYSSMKKHRIWKKIHNLNVFKKNHWLFNLSLFHILLRLNDVDNNDKQLVVNDVKIDANLNIASFKSCKI